MNDVVAALLQPSFARTPPGRLPELMDRPDCDLATLRDALETIDRAGRWSGRDRLLRRGLEGLLRGSAPGEVSLLDVGAGGGHGVLRLSRRLRARGWRPRLVLADLHAGALRIAREVADEETVEVRLTRLCGTRLPFRDRSFDVAVSSNALHHLSDQGAVRMLAEMARVARRGLVVVDLRRSRLAWVGTRLLAETAWRRHPFPRHDGPRSVRRAFAAGEAEELLRAAGLEGGEVARQAFWLAIRWGRSGLEAASLVERPTRLGVEVLGPAGAGA